MILIHLLCIMHSNRLAVIAVKMELVYGYTVVDSIFTVITASVYECIIHTKCCM